MRKTTIIAALAAAGLLATTLAGCTDGTGTPTRQDQLQKSQSKFDNRTPPDVTGDAEYNNYIKAQEEVYDDPSSILWCTGTWANSQAPIVTVPIAGKLTSSSVSYYPGHTIEHHSGDGGGNVLIETQSVDGMYHGSPAPYRYGFTPGGQYVEFTEMGTFCSTALTEFQRQTLQVSAVAPDDGATSRAEKLLKDGDKAGAQALLDGIAK